MKTTAKAITKQANLRTSILAKAENIYNDAVGNKVGDKVAAENAAKETATTEEAA